MDGDEYIEEGEVVRKKPTVVKALLWLGFVVAAPLVAIVLLAWTIIGKLCCTRYWILIVATWALVLLAIFVPPGLNRNERYGFGMSLLDPIVVIVLASAVYNCVFCGYDSRAANLNRRRRLLVLPFAVGVTSYMVFKFAAIRRNGEQWHMHWMWMCLVFSVVLFISAARLWTSASLPQLAEAEAGLLREYGQVDFTQSVVAGLGTVIIKDARDGGHDGDVRLDRQSTESKPLLVLVHGYAAGNGFWMFVLKDLAMHFKVICVEMYGCGRSDRLPFSATGAEEAEGVLVGALEKWRVAMGIERMVLCGHSLGAMLASAYAMSHPYRLKKLVLLSPAGVGGIPSEGDGGGNSLGYKIYAYWWVSGIGPTPFIRWCGPLGSRVAKFVAQKRIEWVPERAKIREVDNHLFGEYIYQLLAQPSSGEKVIFPMLSPMLHAYRPIIETLSGACQAGRDMGDSEQDERGISCPVSIIYGSPDQDWMPQRHGRSLADQLTQQGLRAKVYTVPDAGHTLIVDNPEAFVRIFVDAYFAAGVSTAASGGSNAA